WEKRSTARPNAEIRPAKALGAPRVRGQAHPLSLPRGPGRAVPCPRFPGTAAPSAPTGRVPRSSAIPPLGFPASFLTRRERREVCVVDDTGEPHPLEARPTPTARPFRPGQDIVLSRSEEHTSEFQSREKLV